jgi:hypothetical protein
LIAATVLMTVWRNWTSEISLFFLASFMDRRVLSILKFCNRGWVRVAVRLEAKDGLKVEKTLLVVERLLLKFRARLPPVLNSLLAPTS